MLTTAVRSPSLFELDFSPDWGYTPGHFLDNEHRYTKMHRLLREHYGDLSGRSVLDLGASRGQLLARFSGYPGARLHGLEIDPVEIEHAEARGIEITCAYINEFEGRRMVARLPFDDDSFDVVLAGEIIEHIVDTEGFLREIARVLVPGGATVVSTPNILWWKHRLRLLSGGYPDALDFKLRYGNDFGHVRIFSPEHLRRLLLESGFEDVHLIGKRIGPIASLSKTPAPLGHALDRLADRLPNLSDHMIAVARAPQTA